MEQKRMVQGILQGLKALDARINEGKVPMHNGICLEVKESMGYYSCHLTEEEQDALGTELKECFKAWPEFSGDEEYPVHTGGPSAAAQYLNRRYGEFFCPDTEYGAARLRLLAFMIQYFEEKSHACA